MSGGSTRGGQEGATRTVRVTDSSGDHHPFLRGMVTHDLVQRGLSFEDAYAAAHALRDRLSGREEITTGELKDELQMQLEEMFGADIIQRLGEPGVPGRSLEVEYDGQTQPFSRGLLARSLYAAGVDLDRAYRLVGALQSELAAEGVTHLSNSEVALRVGDLLEREEGATAASRYRLMRGMRRLPKPVVLYISGAGGTGKSTLSVELAPLLRIYRINATDTIRQVMRMVFSSAILPSLHRSSFEADSPELGPRDESDDGRESEEQRIVAAFEEQAIRVLVGVRGVVERSVAENTSLIVEGVHLIPPHVPFPDLQGSSYQVLLTLTTLDREVHRARFLRRGPSGLRRAERYLDRFDAIRIIQDHLLQRSDNHGVPLVDTADGETALQRTLRLLSSMLEKQVPQLAPPPVEAGSRIPALLLIIDGMPDRPVRALGSRTPLQAANTPALDELAREGCCGLADPVAPDVVPDTAAGSLALFGQSPLTLQRGPVEALGAGFVLEPGDIALRANFASLDESGQIVDRRAGRIREDAHELAAALDHMKVRPGTGKKVTVRVRSSTEHRVAIVLQGPGLSSSVSGSDPGDGAPPGPPREPQARDSADEEAVRTAEVLARFEARARRILAEHPVNRRRIAAGELPANALLSRGAGQMHQPLTLEQVGLPPRLTCISGDGTVLGIASWLGSETRTSAAMTANLDTDLRAKFQSALDALRTRDLVVLHVKGADIAAHDMRPDLKASFLEAVDRRLAWCLKRWKGPLRVAVAADHGTLSESGQHSPDPVPVVLWGKGIEKDEVEFFDEIAVASGSLQRFPLQLLVPRLFENSS